MLTKVPAPAAEPKLEENNSAKEARGLCYTKAAEELGTAGAAVAWAAFSGSPRTFQTTSSSEKIAKRLKEQISCKQKRVSFDQSGSKEFLLFFCALSFLDDSIFQHDSYCVLVHSL